MLAEQILKYTELQEFLDNYRACYKDLLDDESLKQFKFDLKRL